MKPDRTQFPPVVIPDAVNVPAPQCAVLSNGIPLHAIDAGGSDVVRLSLVFRAGTRFQSKPYQAGSTLYLLSEGAGGRTAKEISETVDFYGAVFDVTVDRDYAVITVCCLNRFLAPMLELFGDILVRPAFKEGELDIHRNKRKQGLRIEREKISYQARECLARSLFGEGHPYGTFYAVEEYDKLTTGDLREFHRRFYHAGNCFAVASGRLGQAEKREITRFLESVPAGESVLFGELPAIRSEKNVFVEKEDAVQSAIRIGRILFPRNHPDFTGMQVLMMVLGGYFGSRLVSNLREDKGCTYGVFTAMVNLEATGYMAVATEVGAEFTEDAVRQICLEIERLRQEEIGMEELEMVKNMITGELMRILDGPFGVTDVVIENIQNGTGAEYVNDYLREVKNITPARLRDLARRYLAPEDLVTVVVGKK